MRSIGRMTSHGVEDGRTASRLRSGVDVMGTALGLSLTRCRRRVRVRVPGVPGAPGMPGLLLVVVAALFVPRQALAQKKMYWIDPTADKIQRANFDGSVVEDQITAGLDNARFIAIDSAAGKMYWTDLGSDKIQRANLDGTDVEDLVTTGLTTPRGIALDVVGGKMYWIDQGTLKIQRKNLDGTGLVDDLVNTGAGNPRGIALDVAGGKMYWTDQLFDKIQRADLNGDNVEDLVTTGTTKSQGIALDVSGGKMYWTDMDDDTIKRADLNGDNAETLVSGLSEPFGIALDVSGGKMYWCDRISLKIQRANLDGTGAVEDLVTTGLSNPTGIALDLGLTLADHDPPGQETDAFSDGGNETDAELFAFKLDPGPNTISVTQLIFRLSNIANLADLDWVLVEVAVDDNGDGTIDGSETDAVGGGGTVSGSTITFVSSFPVSSATNYILRADFPTLANCAKVTIALNAADVETTATITGSTTSVSHQEGTGCGGGNWMETGTYTGNDTSQSITNVGFQPDVVIVKRYGHRKAYIRTSTMPAGKSREIKKKNPMDLEGIQSLDALGFTVGNKIHVNGLDDTYYWIAFKQKTGVCEVGFYTGTPAAQTVPVAFQPDYVIVVPEANQVSVHRSSEVAGDSKTFGFEGDDAPFYANKITDFVATGFDVGTDPSVNTNGVDHHYVAFIVSSGNVAVGTYQGDGSAGQAISVGFQPEWVLIHADTAVSYIDGSPGTVHRPASMSGDISLNIAQASNDDTSFANCIKALNATGFEVGSDDTVNKGPSGPNYYWMAFADGASASPPKPKIIKWVEVDPYGP